MTAAGWHPDPSGAPGRLRWWDGQSWTDHVHEPAAPPPPATASSPLTADVLIVGAARLASPGCRVFELTDASGGRLGRLVETSRGFNDSAFGAALSRSKGWQHATTREVRGPRGYPELVLSWGPSAPGLIVATLPDRREVGRYALGGDGWVLLGHDGRTWGAATSGGVSGADGGRLLEVTQDGAGGWRAARQGRAAGEPLGSLLAGAAVVADVL